MSSPIVLAFDTSTAQSAVAVCAGERVLAEDNSPAPDAARHGAVLLPRIQRLLAEAEVALGDVGLLAVGVGPGSFTGLRVGLATAKGLGFALGKPVRGVSSMAVLAAAALQQSERALVLVDAFKGEVYAGLYARGEAGALEVVPLFHAEPARAALQLAPALDERFGEACVAIGDGLRRYEAELRERLGPRVRIGDAALDVPRAALLAQRALFDFQRHGGDDLAALEPTYVRDSDARLPERPLRL